MSRSIVRIMQYGVGIVGPACLPRMKWLINGKSATDTMWIIKDVHYIVALMVLVAADVDTDAVCTGEELKSHTVNPVELNLNTTIMVGWVTS